MMTDKPFFNSAEPREDNDSVTPLLSLWLFEDVCLKTTGHNFKRSGPFIISWGISKKGLWVKADEDHPFSSQPSSLLFNYISFLSHPTGSLKTKTEA